MMDASGHPAAVVAGISPIWSPDQVVAYVDALIEEARRDVLPGEELRAIARALQLLRLDHDGPVTTRLPGGLSVRDGAVALLHVRLADAAVERLGR